MFFIKRGYFFNLFLTITTHFAELYTEKKPSCDIKTCFIGFSKRCTSSLIGFAKKWQTKGQKVDSSQKFLVTSANASQKGKNLALSKRLRAGINLYCHLPADYPEPTTAYQRQMNGR
jgi:hypothetical protein